MIKRAEGLIVRALDTDGDGGGTKNANGDYSSAAEIFFIQPPSGVSYNIARMIISVEDTNGMQAEEYGNLGVALSNGIQVRVQDDTGTVLDLTDALVVTANAHWGRLCYDVDIKTWGAGNEILIARWTFARFGVDGLLLRGSYNERLEVVLNDNLTGLIAHYFFVNGYIV